MPGRENSDRPAGVSCTCLFRKRWILNDTETKVFLEKQNKERVRDSVYSTERVCLSSLVSYSHQKSIEISFSYLKHMITKDFSPNQSINWRTRFRIGSPLNGELFDVDGPQRRIDWDGRTLQQLQLLAGIVVLDREQPSRMCPNKTTQRTKRSLVENPAAQHGR